MQNQLDPQIVNLTKAIRSVESPSGDPNAQGQSGEWGSYQFTKDTWNATATKYGVNSAFGEASPQEQNKVAYNRIADWKSQGYNVGQIASMWNAGEGKPDAYLQGNKGTNSMGVAYDTQDYARRVASAYQQFKNEAGMQGGLIPTANAATGQPPIPGTQAPKSVSGFIDNAVSSAGNLVGGLANAVLHPIDTATGILKTAAGTGENISNALFGTKFDTPEVHAANALGQYFVKRYGGSSPGEIVQNIGNTLYTDPAGAALDLSTFLDGVGGVVGKIGKISDIAKATELAKASDFISTSSGLLKGGSPEAVKALTVPGTMSKIADAVNTVSDYTNPINAVGKAARGAVNFGGRIAGEALGVSTGEGLGAIRGAFNAGRDGGESQAAFRAGISGGEEAATKLIDTAQQAWSDIKTQRGIDYQDELNSIKEGTHSLTKEAAKPIFDAFDNLLNKFDITRDTEGDLNFNNSRLRNEPVTVGDIQDIDKEIAKYTSGKKQITPVNIDDLKQYIDSRFSAGSRGSTFTTQLNNVVRKTLRDNVPGYEKMTSNYAKVTDDLKDFRQSLSVGGKASKETILKKLTSTLRGNNEYRQALLKQLSEGANKDLFSQATGVAMQSWIPIGLSKYAEGLAAFINPHVLLALPFSSPRIVGEFVNALGKGNAVLEKIGNGLIKYKAPQALKVGVISNQAQTNGSQNPQ